MAITYPPDCDTNDERLRYLTMFKERFRLVHNVIGLWHREGISLDEYNNGVNGARIGVNPSWTITIPNKIKTQLPYEPQLSQAHWDQFVAWFTTKRGDLHAQLIIYSDLAKQDTTWTPNYDDL